MHTCPEKSVSLYESDLPFDGGKHIGCLVMNKKIYCYGGQNSSTLNDFYYLDVSKDFALQDGQSSWQPINAGGLQPGPNSMFGFVPLYELGVIVLQGGTGPGNGTAMPHTTMIYDPNTNNWRSVDIPNAPPQTQVIHFHQTSKHFHTLIHRVRP